MGWLILAAYIAVGVFAFRSVARRWLAEFGHIEAIDAVLLATYAVTWPIAWPVASLALSGGKPFRRMRRLENWVRR